MADGLFGDLVFTLVGTGRNWFKGETRRRPSIAFLSGVPSGKRGVGGRLATDTCRRPAQ